ncbi:hypothetical protein [Singulisphaera sp. PoT]|uniref:hypothetical protein n=1 Tax=Singulisphaera sp. PoT TaxID=3411797 RepID=UPI003BF48F22
MSNLLTVMFCCNDPDNGMFSHRIDGLDISGLIQLEGPFDIVEDEDGNEDLVGGTEFETEAGSVIVAREKFPILGYRQWVGNWCWDAAGMEVAAVVSLLNHLKRLGWTCMVAESNLFERWRVEGDITAEEFAASIEAAHPEELV